MPRSDLEWDVIFGTHGVEGTLKQLSRHCFDRAALTRALGKDESFWTNWGQRIDTIRHKAEEDGI